MQEFKQIKQLVADKDVRAYALHYAESFIPKKLKPEYDLAKEVALHPDEFKELLPVEYHSYYEQGEYVAQKAVDLKNKVEDLEKQAIEKAIDPIWQEHYGDRDFIEREEVEDFFKMALEKMGKPQLFNQAIFDVAFHQIDLDDNGDIDKWEMVHFTKELLH